MPTGGPGGGGPPPAFDGSGAPAHPNGSPGSGTPDDSSSAATVRS